MKRNIIIFSIALSITASAAVPKLNYKQLNSEARKEYLRPLRTDVAWNTFAKKFLYAPAFHFPERPGARGYLFVLADRQGHRWQMRADSPRASLSPVWNDIPAGTDVTLSVMTIDRSGRATTDTVGRRQFQRDYPFSGPYATPARPYREAALMAMRYIHGLKAINRWKDHPEPDMSYAHHTYACKIIGATLRNEALVARFFPELRDEALLVGRHAAEFLRSISQPEGSPLAYFPPTYYKGLIASARQENQNKTMCMEAVAVGQGLLDLYSVTRDRWYLDWALGIADTYVRLQRPDGSLPIKLDLTTGEPVNSACAMLHPLLRYWLRLHREFGQSRYEAARQRGQQWMHDVAIRRFDMTGQFEDCSVLGLQPYENLTNCTAAPYAQRPVHPLGHTPLARRHTPPPHALRVRTIQIPDVGRCQRRQRGRRLPVALPTHRQPPGPRQSHGPHRHRRQHARRLHRPHPHHLGLPAQRQRHLRDVGQLQRLLHLPPAPHGPGYRTKRRALRGAQPHLLTRTFSKKS